MGIYYKITYVDHVNYYNPVTVELNNRFCLHGLHQKLIWLVNTEICIEWHEDQELFIDIIKSIGIPESCIEINCGDIEIIRPLPDVKMYNMLTNEIGKYFHEEFVEIKVTKYET